MQKKKVNIKAVLSLIFCLLGAVFLCYYLGTEMGAPIGEFIFNLTH